MSRPDGAPRTFELVRDVDETGVSGTGVVAQGVEFADDGTCVLHWCVGVGSTAVYDCMDDVVLIHGHGGKTRVVFHDGDQR